MLKSLQYTPGCKKSCKYPGCQNRYFTGGINKHFFKFPRNEKLKILWLRAVNLPLDTKCQSFNLCEEHFTDKDFTNVQKIRLNHYAIPDRTRSFEDIADEVLGRSSGRQLAQQNSDNNCESETVVKELFTIPQEKERKSIIMNNHNSHGNESYEDTLNKIKPKYRWEKMEDDIRDYINNCSQCQLFIKLDLKFLSSPITNKETNIEIDPTSDSSVSNVMPNLDLVLPKPKTFDTIYFDVVGPFEKTADFNKYILIIEDSVSRYVEIFPLKHPGYIDSIKIYLINDIFLRYGMPKRIITYHDCESYIHEFVTKICNFFRIEFSVCEVPHNEKLLDRLKSYTREYLATWDQYLPAIRYAVNSSVNTCTLEIPNMVMFNQEVDTADKLCDSLKKCNFHDVANTRLFSHIEHVNNVLVGGKNYNN